jgi:uncharacterized protein
MPASDLLRESSQQKSDRGGAIRLRRSGPGLQQETFAGIWAMKPTLLDTGVIVGLLDRSEDHHARCVIALEGLEGPLVTCEAVIAESCYLLRQVPGAAETVVENVERGIFQIPFQLSRSANLVRKLTHKYCDRPMDLAGACLVQLADELNTGDILTLDRDFESYRWRRTRPFRLLVPLD